MVEAWVEHLGIVAKDPEALANWYCQLFGFKVVYKGSKTPATYFVAPAAGGTMFEIMPAGEPGVPEPSESMQGLRHIALAVADIEAAHQVLLKNAVPIMYAREASGGVKVVFFRDPEGNIVHLIYRPTPLV